MMGMRSTRATLAVNALVAAMLAAPALTVANAAPADFQAALADYRAGHYEAAHAAFPSLAELGNCSAQFNLAAMALHGQGGPKDPGSGAGWLQAAAGNGCGELVANHLAALTGKLSPEEARAAAASAQQQLAVDQAKVLGWNTRTLAEQLDAYRHDRAWHGDLLASL
jgi:TPR repeat protein